jgi:hypothetical protein
MPVPAAASYRLRISREGVAAETVELELVGRRGVQAPVVVPWR